MKDDIMNKNTLEKTIENNPVNSYTLIGASNIIEDSNIEEVKDITNEIKNVYGEIQIKGKKIDEIFDYIKKNPLKEEYDSYILKKYENAISLEDDDNDFEEHLLFTKELTIYYKKVSTYNKILTLVDKSVKSSAQIEKAMKLYHINYLSYEDNQNYNFPEYKNILLNLVNSNKLVINFISFMECLDYVHNDFCFNTIPKTLDMETISKYSVNYIAYSDNKIEYIETDERNYFLLCLQNYIRNQSANLFKITGPSNDGKTMTLLLFSRLKKNIIYFNLKFIMKLFYSHNNDYLNVMIYELGRASLSTENKTNIVAKFKNSEQNNPWNLIYEITKLLLNEKKIIILDQFKEKTVDNFYYNKIEEEVIGKKLKFIICSSINDKGIKRSISNTLTVFRGNPNQLNKESQHYYFYFCNILSKSKLKQLYMDKNMEINYFSYFGYNPKYIHQLNKYVDKTISLQIIKSHIISQIKDTYQEQNISENEILNFVSMNIDKELDYSDAVNVLSYTPLKYFKLELQKDFFKLHYSFIYMKEIIDEIKKDIDKYVDDYFKNDKSKHSNFYKLLQPYYYEESCIAALKKNQMLSSNKNYQINVKTIAELKEYEEEEEKQKQKEIKLDTVLYKKLDKEISLKEYYELNIGSIAKIIDENGLEEKKSEEDISYHRFEALKARKDDLNDFLKKKRYKIKNNDGIEEEVDIEKKKIKIYKYDDSFCKGEIFINQGEKGGKTLDFGFLGGGQNSKIFIGFQMKSYSKGTSLSTEKKKNLTKQKIKESLRDLLVQASLSYDIYIEEWHYFMIIDYDQINKTFNTSVRNTCIDEGLEYMFYDPKYHSFYDKNFEKIEGELQLTFNSNLDYNKDGSPDLIFENFHSIEDINYKYCKISSYKKMLDEKANIFIQTVDKNMKLIELNRKIKNKVDGIKKLNLISIYYFSQENPSPIPNNSYLFIFINNTCDDYVYYYKKENSFYCGLVLAEKNDKISPFQLPGYINPTENNSMFLVYKFY